MGCGFPYLSPLFLGSREALQPCGGRYPAAGLFATPDFSGSALHHMLMVSLGAWLLPLHLSWGSVRAEASAADCGGAAGAGVSGPALAEGGRCWVDRAALVHAEAREGCKLGHCWRGRRVPGSPSSPAAVICVAWWVLPVSCLGVGLCSGGATTSFGDLQCPDPLCG